jgi:hypothetical protein
MEAGAHAAAIDVPPSVIVVVAAVIQASAAGDVAVEWLPAILHRKQCTWQGSWYPWAQCQPSRKGLQNMNC